MSVMKTKVVKAGDWRTLEWFWNAKGTAFFKSPAGAKIRVIKGFWIFSSTSQKQTLDGVSYKKLTVAGFGTLATARMQIRVEADTNVTYEVHPDGIAISSPKIDF